MDTINTKINSIKKEITENSVEITEIKTKIINAKGLLDKERINWPFGDINRYKDYEQLRKGIERLVKEENYLQNEKDFLQEKEADLKKERLLLLDQKEKPNQNGNQFLNILSSIQSRI